MLDQSIEINETQQQIRENVVILDKIRLNAETPHDMQLKNLIVIYGPQSEDRRRLKNGLITGSLIIEPGEDFLSKPLQNFGDYSLYDCYYDPQDQIENVLQIVRFTTLVEKSQQVQLFLVIPQDKINKQIALLYEKIQIIFINQKFCAITLIITQSTRKFKYNGNSLNITKLIENCFYLPLKENHVHNDHFLRGLIMRKKQNEYYQKIVKFQSINKMRDPELVSIAQNCVNIIKDYNEKTIFQFYISLKKMILEVSKQKDQQVCDLIKHIHKLIKKIEQFHNYDKLCKEINQFIILINEWSQQISNNIQQIQFIEEIDDYDVRRSDDLLEYFSKFYLTTRQSECWNQLLNYLMYIAYKKGIDEEIQIKYLGEFDKILTQKSTFLNQINPQFKTGVLFFGKIRVGKSTLVNLLTENQLVLRQNFMDIGFDCENTNFEIGHQATSQTSVPQFYNDEENKITFIDIPGFGDQGTDYNDDINRLIIKEIQQKFEKIVIFLVIEFQGLMNNVTVPGESISQFKTQFGIKDNLLEHIHLIITKAKRCDQIKLQQHLEQNYNSQNIQKFNANQFLYLLKSKSVYFYEPQFYLNQQTQALDIIKLNETKQQILQFINGNQLQPQPQFENFESVTQTISNNLKPKFECLANKTNILLYHLQPFLYKIIIEAYKSIQYKKSSLIELIEILTQKYQLNQIKKLLLKLKSWLNKYYFNNPGIQNQQIDYMINFYTNDYNPKLYDFCDISIDLKYFEEEFTKLQNDIDNVYKQFENIESVLQCVNTLIIFAGTTAVAPVIFRGALTVDIVRLFLQRSTFSIKFGILYKMMNGQQINLQQIQHQELQRKIK